MPGTDPQFIKSSASGGTGFDDHQTMTSTPGEANLIGHKVKFYPGFGEKNSKAEEKSWKRVALEVAAVGVVILAGVAIGFLVGNIPGAVIGGAIAVGLIVTAAACKMAYDKTMGHRFLMELPKEEQPEAPDRYKLGHYYDSDLRLTSTADEGFEWKKKLIESAEETIELSANFAGGSSFREFLHLVDKKMTEKPNVKTHLIISVDFVEQEDDKLLKELQKKFGKRFRHLRTDRHLQLALRPYTEENHVKMLVVDGKYFVSGGTSIHPRLVKEQHDAKQGKERPTPTAKLLDPSARDMDIVGESAPLASIMREQFFSLYRLWEIRTKNKMVRNRFFTLQGSSGNCQEFTNKEGLLKGVRLKCIVGGPEHRGNNPIVGEYVKRIDKAQQEIRLANWMFNPDIAIKKALTNARAAGTKKKIIGYVNGKGSNFTVGKASIVIPSRGNYPLLDKAYEAQTPDQIYHKKVATFDDKHTMIGSFNLSKKSAKFDHEIAFVIKDERITSLCKTVLKEDARRARKIPRKEIIQNHFFAKIASAVVLPLVENFL